MEESLRFELIPEEQERLNRLCGPTNSTLKQIEETLKIKISNRGFKFRIKGSKEGIGVAKRVLKVLYEKLEKNIDISPEEIHLYLREIFLESLGVL